MSCSTFFATLVIDVLVTGHTYTNDNMLHQNVRRLFAVIDENLTTTIEPSTVQSTLFYPEVTDTPFTYEVLMDTISDYQLPIIACVALTQLILFCCFIVHCCKQRKTINNITQLSDKIDGLIRRMSNSSYPSQVTSHSVTAPHSSQSPSFNPILPTNPSDTAIRIKSGTNMTNYRGQSIPSRSPRSPVSPPMDGSRYTYYAPQQHGYPNTSPICRTISDPTSSRQKPKSVSTDDNDCTLPARTPSPRPNPTGKSNKQLLEMGQITLNRLHPASSKLANVMNTVDEMAVPIQMNMAHSKDSTLTTTTRTLTMDSLDEEDEQDVGGNTARPWSPKRGNQTCLPPLPVDTKTKTNSARLAKRIYSQYPPMDEEDEDERMMTLGDKNRLNIPRDTSMDNEESVWSDTNMTVLINGQSALSMASVNTANTDSVLGEMLGLNTKNTRKRIHTDIVLEIVDDVLDENGSKENTCLMYDNGSESY
eukprot:543237_1